MTYLARRTDTGDEVEVLALTADDLALVAPPRDRPHAVLIPRGLLEPDPFWDPSFQAWTDASMAPAEA